MQHWSLDIQHQFGKNTIVDVGYYGSKGTHLIGIVDINLLPPGTAEHLLCPVNKSSSTDFDRVNVNQPVFPLRWLRICSLDTVRPYRGYRSIA